MMSNSAVKRAFMKGRSGASAHLLSTGLSLLSYNKWEVARWLDGKIVLRNGPSCSQTTARHRSGIRGRLSSIETPIWCGELRHEKNWPPPNE